MQFVDINGSQSNKMFIKHGVPQGSILGPLLFNLFINDISKIQDTNTHIIMYADDTVLICADKNSDQLTLKINKTLQKIFRFCKMNSLILNLDKTKGISFNKKNVNTLSNVYMGNHMIDFVNSYKYLEYIIDSELKFSDLKTCIHNKLKSCNLILQRCRPYFPVEFLKLIFNSIGLSHIIYNKCILIFFSKNELRCIESKLIGAGSIIHNCLKSHINDNNYNLDYQLKFYFLLYIHNIVNDNVAPCLNTFTKKNHVYNTKSKNKYFINFCYSNNGIKAFSNLAPKIWNKLPDDINSLTSKNQFKSELKKFLCSIVTP
jgi:hypothetical protein